MSFDLPGLRTAIGRHGTVVRVVVAETRGSAPREPGAAMVVWADGQSGTIGGGALELQTSRTARAQLHGGPPHRLSTHPLGPGLGQCCGGAVSLVAERWDAEALEALDGSAVVCRRVAGTAALPMALRAMVKSARNGDAPARLTLRDGWLVEPVTQPTRQIWIHGAGHVGRALIGVLAPLPELALTWVDTAPARFPDPTPDGVRILPAADPARLIPHAPPGAEHYVLTYSHELDLRLCDALLRHGFGRAGLIGSATKWARFRTRLGALGHTPARIAQITCPIGDPRLGKAPQQIAIGIAQRLLAEGPVAAAAPRTGQASPIQDIA